MNQTVLYRVDCAASGKSYFGITKRPLKRRWQDHVRNSKHESIPGLAGAIRKYGVEAFTVSCIASFDTRREAEDAERAAIVEFGTMAPGGYNLSQGGDGGTTRFGAKHSKETKEKISKAHLGVPQSPEHREANGAARRGKPLKPEHAAKIRLIGRLNKGKKRTEVEKIAGRLRRREEARSQAGASGIVGVYPSPHGRWYARIKCDGVRKRLGGFPTKEGAAARYAEEEAKHLSSLQYALPSGKGDASQPLNR
jgi:group I intron endonuclease